MWEPTYANANLRGFFNPNTKVSFFIYEILKEEERKAMNLEKISEYEKSLPDLDLADWQQYQMSLSRVEMRMKHAAMLNVRTTRRFLAENSKGSEDKLSEEETSAHIRMMIGQLSQIENWSFEAWREARRSRIASTISATIGVAGLALLVTVVYLTF